MGEGKGVVLGAIRSFVHQQDSADLRLPALVFFVNRDDLLAQHIHAALSTPTPSMLEAGARALWDDAQKQIPPAERWKFHEADEAGRVTYTERAKAVWAAMDGAR